MQGSLLVDKPWVVSLNGQLSVMIHTDSLGRRGLSPSPNSLSAPAHARALHLCITYKRRTVCACDDGIAQRTQRLFSASAMNVTYVRTDRDVPGSRVGVP